MIAESDPELPLDIHTTMLIVHPVPEPLVFSNVNMAHVWLGSDYPIMSVNIKCLLRY